MKRLLVPVFLLAIACSSTQKPTAKKVVEPDAEIPSVASSATPTSTSTPRRDCIIVQDENPVPVRVVGVLVKAPGGGSTDAPFLLRLSEPRCVIGLPRASFVREVYVATAGPDLRPLVDRRLLIEGNAIGGLSDMGGPAVIVLAKDIENAVGTSPAP